MTPVEYRYRLYCSGDEEFINALYYRVTGRLRSAEQFRWQWLEAPGGIGEMWLIEAVHADGRIELIGHHGIMPVRFTCGNVDLLFGKTENTMVLPEYRRRILYPRFEKIFASEYESRFHALFSTMGPVAAVRQRKAHGYASEHVWVSCENGVGPFSSLVRFASRYERSFPLASMFRQNLGWKGKGITVRVLDASEARQDTCFDSYWTSAREHWGVAPRRDRADLAWRYWDNPYVSYLTLVFEQRSEMLGFAVVDMPFAGHARIVDVSFLRAEIKCIDTVMNALLIALRRQLGCVLHTMLVTDDFLPSSLDGSFRQHFKPSWLTRLYRAHRSSEDIYMPRKITQKGVDENVPAAPWGITPIIFEGRA